jgi:hypothetical protein
MNWKRMNENLRLGTRSFLTVMLFSAVMLCAQLVFAKGPESTEHMNVETRIAEPTGISGVLKVNVPFAFSVGGKTLEAGDYYISPNGEKWISIKDAAAKKTVFVLTNAVSLGTKVTAPKLVFHRYGNSYFLAQAWLRYSDEGRQVFESREEAQIARDLRQQREMSEAGR